MYQFFVEPSQINISDKRVIITGPDVNHIRNVLRMKPGEELSVRGGPDGREYRCGILSLGEEILCELRFIKEDNVELPARIYLFQGLPKGDKMELIVQKAVELGVHQVIPVAAARCVVKLDGKLIPYELAEDMARTRRLLEGIGPGQSVAVFIGPEGGFEEAEIGLALAEGVEPITLGKRILRTETAGLAVLSWMMYLLEA